MAEYTDPSAMAPQGANMMPQGEAEPGEAPETPDAPDKPERKKRIKKSIKVASQQLDAIVKNLNRDLNDRQGRIDKRMTRYAKLRGWMEQKDWPWANSSNMWLPIMLTASLRTKATLENAVKSTRPTVLAKARQRTGIAKQENINKLLDYQVYVENNGEPKFDSFISNFVDDEAAFVFTHWIKENQNIVDIRVLPEPDENTPLTAQALQAIQTHMQGVENATMTDDQGYSWDVEMEKEGFGEPQTVKVEFYDRDDERWEMCMTGNSITYNGPTFEVLDFEDVVFPVRSANLQPPGPSNPLGAPYVNRLCTASLDTIKRRIETGVYDLAKKKDFDTIKASKSVVGSGQPEDEPKAQKDQMEGVDTLWAGDTDDNRQIVEHYGRLDINGDGLEEDVIITFARASKVLLRARALTEIYPGLPVLRPFMHDSIFPIPNRVYGMSLPEMIEWQQSASETLMNQHIDWGTITNMPWFGYRAASGFKPEPIQLMPGQGIPLDNPQADLVFPQFPTKDSGFALNTMAVLAQFGEKLTMMNAASYGMVPTGKASAFRTVGTTMGLLQQSDVRSEQILRRLFHAVCRLYQMFHRLNRSYLPENKEIRILGYSEKGEQPYTAVSPNDIDADMDFDFGATMLNTNKQMLAQQMQTLAGLMLSPIALQLGIVTPDEIYHLFRKLVISQDQDPDEFLQRPPSVLLGPKITAEEAITFILHSEAPVGHPMEPIQMHLEKLAEFTRSPAAAALSPIQQALLQQYLQQVMQMMQIQMQQQMMMAQSANGAPGEPPQQGPGGVMSNMTPPGAESQTPVGRNEMIDGSAEVQ